MEEMPGSWLWNKEQKPYDLFNREKAFTKYTAIKILNKQGLEGGFLSLTQTMRKTHRSPPT